MGRWAAYVTAGAALAVAVLARRLLDPILGDALPFVTLFGAVAAAVWLGGYRSGLVISALGYLACSYLFMAPRGRFVLLDAVQMVALVAYAVTCALIIAFGEVTRRAHRRAQEDKTEQLLTARLLSSIIESSNDAIISKSLDGVIKSWNAAAERLFGYTSEQAVGRHISLIIPPERLAEEDRIIASLRAGKRVDHYETERMRSDGTRVIVSLTISPIKNAEGLVVGASKIARDITERKAVEAEREKFVTLIESSTDFIGICDLNGMPLFINHSGLEMVGLADMDQARRTPVSSFFFDEDQAGVMQTFFPRVLAEGHGEMEVRFRHFKTGEARWMAYKVLTLVDDAGRPMAFATVSQDVTQRKRMADDLRNLAAELSGADRRKNEFLAMLAHELRNPLAPISNATRALRMANGDGKAVRAASEMLERQVGQMARLVDDLLDMSRITRGKIEVRKERVELAPIVAQAVEAVRELYRSRENELTISVPGQRVYVDGDPARLAQVVGNLLNNAFKFTDKGAHIELKVTEEDGQAVIRVRDDGIGIAAAHLPRLFDMFAQVDTSLERSRDGLGIGLTLVKTLAELHGGSVEAQSEGLGRGSEFVVRLPTAAEGPKPSAEEVVAQGAAQRRRVLIVDDNLDGAESLAMMLEMNGHETHRAHDGLDAIEAAQRLRPDAVLLDIGLPSLNGYEVCRRIREKPWGKGVTMVAMTGWGQEEDRRRSKEAGFDTHMIKPVDPNALVGLLASLPSKKSTTRSAS